MQTAEIERIDRVIDNLQADRRPLSGMEPAYPPGAAANEVALIMAASTLNAMRPGAARPDPDFLSSLRERMVNSGW